MAYLGGSLDCGAGRGGRLVVTGRARDAIRCLCRAGGPQALVVGWPADVTCLPAARFSPSEFDVILGHIAGCPVYADVRQLGTFADTPAVLDLAEPMRWPRAAAAATALRPARRQCSSSATGWGRDAVTLARSRQVRSEISAELYGEFRGLLSDEAIRGYVREAMTDLRGSISCEALPEMAVRLARVRLAALAESRAAAGPNARMTRHMNQGRKRTGVTRD